MSTEQTKIQSVFKDLYEIELEKTTLVIKEITNEAWSDETKQTGVFFIEQKNRQKKGISLTKKDFEKLIPIFKEISLK
jgi:preprotein translocase subunit SecB|tara:strand:- start:162 stop:395 length:234 start_codon:yes stop_codon:yes gene_type:complete